MKRNRFGIALGIAAGALALTAYAVAQDASQEPEAAPQPPPAQQWQPGSRGGGPMAPPAPGMWMGPGGGRGMRGPGGGRGGGAMAFGDPGMWQAPPQGVPGGNVWGGPAGRGGRGMRMGPGGRPGLGLGPCGGTGIAPAGRGFRGVGPGMGFGLGLQGDEVTVTVKATDDGLQRTIETDDPQWVPVIQAHAEMMASRDDGMRPRRMMDPLFADLYLHRAEVERTVTRTEKGARIVERGKTAEARKLLQAVADAANKAREIQPGTVPGPRMSPLRAAPTK